tara:strand:+ start:12582 stop:13358 length:777 start_codon:yes stop_codon:yes gene_type:complete
MKILFPIIIFFSLIYPDEWGSTGHRVIAEVADNYLTDNSRVKILDILEGETLVNASTYADDIKSDSRYDKYYDWHFLNMELDDNYQDIKPSEKGDVYIAINRCIDILKSSSASDKDKSFYLKLLVHFVGDLHQPLHIGRYEDRGANRIYVKWFGRNSNLHRVWDSEMINSHNMSYSELALNLPNPDFVVFTDESNDFERSDILEWVNEIHEYTNKIYNDVSIDDKLGYEYQYENFGTVRDLLLIAGIRLAKILNYLFD